MRIRVNIDCCELAVKEGAKATRKKGKDGNGVVRTLQWEKR